MTLMEALGVAIEKGWAFIAAVVVYGVRVESRLSKNRTDIDTLRTQRTEDRDGFDKVLAEIKADIRGLRTDLQDVFKAGGRQ